MGSRRPRHADPARQRDPDLDVHAGLSLVPTRDRRSAQALLKHPIRYRAWTLVSKLNAQHGLYAWLSLFSVAIADFYVYLLATGTFGDPRFF